MEPGRITETEVKNYWKINLLTWHELNDGKTIQLVQLKKNAKHGRLGGVGEVNAGAYKPGGFANK